MTGDNVTIGKDVVVSRRALNGPTIAALDRVANQCTGPLKGLLFEPSAPAVVPPASPEPEPLDPTTTALQAAIHESPDDEAARLVLADHLLSADDPRGELIVLDARERETTEGITDVEALEHYLLLAAEYSFPNARPEEPTLPFVRISVAPLELSTTFRNERYTLRYSGQTIELIRENGNRPISQRLHCADPYMLTDDERTVIVQLVSDALRHDTPLGSLRFPYGRDPLPTYAGGPLRGYRLPREFTEPRGIAKTRYGLAARDFRRWLAVWARLARLTRG
jgi:uncharacterized protein (TIGR02996 family)